METLYLTKTDRYGNKILIGELAKSNSEYSFKYTLPDIDKPEGFFTVPTFKNKDKIYKSDKLFLFFAGRMFDKGRPDLLEILKSYGLKDYDEWELLKATKGRSVTDRYELSSSF